MIGDDQTFQTTVLALRCLGLRDRASKREPDGGRGHSRIWRFANRRGKAVSAAIACFKYRQGMGAEVNGRGGRG